MSKECGQNKEMICDLFGRDMGSSGASGNTDDGKTDNRVQERTPTSHTETGVLPFPQQAVRQELPVVPPAHISEDLWEDAKRRHCDARRHWRTLLNRYIKPHH